MLKRNRNKKSLITADSLDKRFLKITEKMKFRGKKRDLELTLLFTGDSVFFTTGSVESHSKTELL